MNRLGIYRRRWLISLFVAGIAPGLAPWGRAEEPRWLKLNSLPQASVGVEVEGSSEETTTGGNRSTYDHLSLRPFVGLKTAGSIYHPNLLAFDLDGELGWGWDTMTARGPGYTQTSKESSEMMRYLAQFNFLQAKPYNASAYAAQDHSYRDYGFFNSYTVDSERYGGRVSWNTDNMNLNAELGYRDEKSSGLTGSTGLIEKFFNFSGIYHRRTGQTSMYCRLNEFDNTLSSGGSLNSVSRAVGVADSESFGRRRQINTATGASYSETQSGGREMKTIAANENININHRPRLDSYFMFNFGRSEMTSATAAQASGMYGIRHQLYDSLTSTLDAHGSYDDSSGSGGTSSSDRYGLGIAEGYAKRLGSWGRLSLSTGVVADHQDSSSSGGILTTIDEAHQLYSLGNINYHPVYLNNPRVVGAILVMKGALDVTSDCEFWPQGELMEIRLKSLHSPNLNEGDTVTVTYQSEALSNAAYDVLSVNSQIRLDLPGGFGVYGRLNWMGNNAPPEVVTQSLTDLVAGADYKWRWLRAGAEYENYDSNFSQFDAWRFYQDLNFRIDNNSSLGMNFSETFYRYPNDRSQDVYQFITRYSLQLLTSLAWYVEGGVSRQEVMGSDQLMESARTGVTWTRGKLSLRTGYEYNGQSTASGRWTQELAGNRFFLYLKRAF
ncbi:MAG: hypothetical protein WCH99_13085 [Verrucomicrobiota bacterium]